MSQNFHEFLANAIKDYESVVDEEILIVAVIGKDSSTWTKGDILNKVCKTNKFVGQNDEENPEVFIETCFSEKDLVLYLVVHGVHDPDLQLKLFTSESNQHKSFFEKLAQAELEELQLLHAVFVLSHVIFFLEQGRYFDVHWVKTLSKLNTMRTDSKYLIIRKLELDENLSFKWIEHGRLAVPRLCFIFPDKMLRNDLNLVKKKEISGRLAQCWEGQIYSCLKYAEVVDVGMANSLGHLPELRKLNYVFVCKPPKDEPIDILAEMVMKLSEGKEVTVHEDEFDFDCSTWIKNHVNNAYNYGEEDKHFNHFPTLKEFVIGAEIVMKTICKNPKRVDDLSNLIPELELVQWLEVSNFEKGFHAYKKALQNKGHFNQQEHETELNNILDELKNTITGDTLEQVIESVKNACVEYWEDGHQRCEAVSLTGHNCKYGYHEDNRMAHSSGFKFLSTCTCGKKQATRNDPFNLKEANYDFYRQSFNCCGTDHFYHKFPLFIPDDYHDFIDEKKYKSTLDDVESITSETRAKKSESSIIDTAALSGDLQSDDEDDDEVEDCFDRYIDDDKLKEMFLNEENDSKVTKTDDPLISSSRSEEICSPTNDDDEPIGNYLETYDSQITGAMFKNTSITYEKLLKNFKGQFLEYMPCSNATPGLLPGFPSWAVYCVGQSNRYSHNKGLTGPNFKFESDFLLPFDYILAVKTAHWDEDVRLLARDKQAYRRNNRSPISDDEIHREKLRFFLGFEYECPRGHRFIIEKPGKVLQHEKNQGIQVYKDVIPNLIGSDIPIWMPCTCRRSPSVPAQLMKLHIVLPKAPIITKLDLKVQPNNLQTEDYFYPTTEPIELVQNRYYIVRLPFVYEGPNGPIWPPRSAKTCGRLLKNWMTVEHVRISKRTNN